MLAYWFCEIYDLMIFWLMESYRLAAQIAQVMR
jgi:hypothetical protein